MSDNGYSAELSNAATRLADAITSGDVVALRLAAADHAAALGSQSTAMSASIATMLITHMDKALSPVVRELENQNKTSLDWRASLRTHLDDRFDAYGKELDELKVGLARLYKSEVAIADLRKVQDAHATAIEILQQQGRDDTTAAILKLEQRMQSYEQEHAALLLRLEQRKDSE